MPPKTSRFDAAEVLDTPEAIEAFLEDAFESADPAFVTHALRVVARSATTVHDPERIGRSTLRSNRRDHRGTWAVGEE